MWERISITVFIRSSIPGIELKPPSQVISSAVKKTISSDEYSIPGPENGVRSVVKKKTATGYVITRAYGNRNKDRDLQRHSVEVTTGAGGYRHIRPNDANRAKAGLAPPAEGAITEEIMTSSGNSEVTENQQHSQPAELASGANNGQTTVNFLPPALNCMVRLWDEIANDMLQVRQRDISL